MKRPAAAALLALPLIVITLRRAGADVLPPSVRAAVLITAHAQTGEARHSGSRRHIGDYGVDPDGVGPTHGRPRRTLG